MIDLRLLEQLIAFNDCGTLSKAAEQLLISQPALTRSMQRLENELGVQLFTRTKNRMTLTDTGYYTVAQARQLLRHSQEFLNKVHHHALQQLVLFIGSCAPGPIFEITYRINSRMPNQKITTKQEEENTLKEALLNETYQIVITTAPLDDSRIATKPFFTEKLFLSVLDDHPLAKQESITLDDLAGLTMLLRTHLGIWNHLVSRLTKTTFIKQNDNDTFIALVNASNLPSFTTNLSQFHGILPKNRVNIPISDSEAAIPFFINTLKKNHHIVDELL
ncbi:LysR family transcriptional regulator [Veillonella criceti]|uniref:Morphology and auto-aggregation control protein n=1 Tax=Veillonella criceti TaxID=103891 RepID=A0A380NHJ7_9FIRM|nr:LysR family transcriptional regulator [Veillonella criceti]SUP41268.1 Morphology and auto-aggregation control protein [Veillonella criceti]